MRISLSPLGILLRAGRATKRVDWEGLGYWLIVLLALGFLVAMMTSCNTTVQYQCPPLAPPPMKVVTSLQTAGKSDPSSAAWVVGLEKHYEKCEALSKLH